MLDENLPTFQFKQQPENPLACPVYFSQNGSEPAAEYVFERAHPSTVPAAAGHYAVALKDPYATDVIYAEVVVAPEWQQPSLSAAEIRAQQQQGGQPGGGAPVAHQTPVIPDTFTIQLYDPDQTVLVRYSPSSLTRTESWEFEMLSQSFKIPTPSQLDRQAGSGTATDGNGTGNTTTIKTAADFRPRIMFKWKREGRLTKDMACYNVGKSLGKHKSKEPDITVALFKAGRETTITVYEPNLQRVEMEDRKGLDIVLVLGAEVIRDLYLAPEKRGDLFNIGSAGSGVVTAANGKRKNSRTMTLPMSTSSTPTPPLSGGGGPLGRARTTSSPLAMSGALGQTVPPPSTTIANSIGPTKPNGIDPETLKLMKQMKKEDDEQLKRQARERQRREAEERRHVEEMLKFEEEQERHRRQAEVDRETERLRQLYGDQGQSFGGSAHPLPASTRPPQPQPPRPVPSPLQQQHQQFEPGSMSALPPQAQQPNFAPPPRRPISMSFGGSSGGGAMGPFNSSSLTSLFRSSNNNNNNNNNNNANGSNSGNNSISPQPGAASGTRPNGRPYGSTQASVSSFFQNVLDPKKPNKKKSMQW